MPIKNDKLKPCPFCGAEVEMSNYGFGVVGVITCQKCKTKFVIPWGEAVEVKDLFDAWNRRVNEQ